MQELTNFDFVYLNLRNMARLFGCDESRFEPFCLLVESAISRELLQDEGMVRKLVMAQKNQMNSDISLVRAKREAIELCNGGNASGTAFTRMYDCDISEGVESYKWYLVNSVTMKRAHEHWLRSGVWQAEMDDKEKGLIMKTKSIKGTRCWS
jgi:hypothetical protein